jgi:hypothetical protein
MYLKLDDKARQRNLFHSREMELAFLDMDNLSWPGFMPSKHITSLKKK